MTPAEIEKSIATFTQQVKAQPQNPEALHNLSVLLGLIGEMTGALTHAKQAVIYGPNTLEAWLNLGNLEAHSKNHKAAIQAFERVTQIGPDDSRGWFNLGNVLAQSSAWDKSIEALEQADQISPQRVDILASLALAYRKHTRLDDAVETYRKALKLEPTNAPVHSNLIVALQYNSNSTEELLVNVHREWGLAHHTQSAEQAFLAERTQTPVRIGYVSGDFRTHPIGYFLLGVLPNHDRNEVHVTCFSDTVTLDGTTKQLRETADAWIDTRGISDEGFCKAVRNQKIDILIDLSGHFNHNRLTAFARRAAPIQVSWAGYVGTTGVISMDWLIGDKFHTPDGSERYSTERIARLPHDYVCYAPPQNSPAVGPLPCDAAPYVTFGCFNNHVKINDGVLSLWAKILTAIPNSKIIIKCADLDHTGLREQISGTMSRFGITEGRLDLRSSSPPEELLETYNEVDIALDTFPYSGGLTTLEALWMGVPVITKTGETFAGRHSTSHLSAVGLNDWIADNENEYVKIASDMAGDRGTLRSLRASLRNKLLSSPICNHIEFTRTLERTFMMMQEDLATHGANTTGPRMVDISTSD